MIETNITKNTGLITDAGYSYIFNYRARVEKISSHGCLKLYIPGITPERFINENEPYLLDYLPDAQPAVSLFAGNNPGNGVFSYPHVGSWVWCFFEGGDYQKPIYFAASPGGEDSNLEYLNIANEFNLRKYETSAKTIEDAHLHTTVVGNNRITIDETGNLSLIVGNYNPNLGNIYYSDEDLYRIKNKGTYSKYEYSTIVDVKPEKTTLIVGGNDTEVSSINNISATTVEITPQSTVISIQGGTTITLTQQNINISTLSTLIKSPKIEIEGDISLSGNISMLGNIGIAGGIQSTEDIVADTISLMHHKHPTAGQGDPSEPTP